jgi:hypothetical protein
MPTTSSDQTSPAASLNDIVLWLGIDWAEALLGQPPAWHLGFPAPLGRPEASSPFFLGLRQQYPQGRIGVVLEQSRGALL